MGQAACVDPGGGHQQRETQLLSDAKSTIGKFLQASPHAKMHVQVQRFAGQLHFCQKKKKKINLFLSWTLNPSKDVIEVAVSFY